MLIGVEIGLLLIAGLLYLRRAITLAGTAEAVSAPRALSFYAGLALIAAAAIALDGPADELLYFHTTEHLLISDIAALLIVLGLTRPVLGPLRASLALRPLRIFVHPAVALVLWGANMALWHLREPFEAAIHSEALHLLQHLLMVLLGVAVWIALIGPVRRPRWFGAKSKLAYLLLWRIFGAALGAVSIWVPVVFYPYYMRGDTLHALSPLADEGITGSIALAEMALMAIGLLLWLYVQIGREAAAAAEAQQRPQSRVALDSTGA